jgi:hypothetical protein
LIFAPVSDCAEQVVAAAISSNGIVLGIRAFMILPLVY